MKKPVQITYQDIGYSESIEARINEKASKLDQFFDQIMAVKVVLETDSHQHKKGNLYHVGINIVVPDNELVVNRAPREHHAHEDIYVAIRDAFDAAKRQLQEYSSKRRGDVKKHQTSLHGKRPQFISA